ncbi:PIG-L family deacetylase [Sanguibacter antarcticus]|uniref:N-acetyl-1-D-myo-inositol-2-amino-2-deoxy-alpha-D-glucopyranoside deacetylase n=1 Tax=Sanguibacter antarcticus TaxID=372484 RepID=A0A2A9E474_9MICO|nr:PIG-L family deacetylase [Sanguibacter antarcticus]PFG33758.1 N-acetyl-1-D-myo-inositol-2-amino-2-deoxy-alpha-D-glucopyranoside deacetylase [Sanguibacter antarcticus]
MTDPSPAPVVPHGRLLVVHAHPDDETLATGGLLAAWAASGEPVTLVTCTRGERGEVIGDELAHLEGDGPRLAAHRETELAAALRALGVQDHAFLDELPPPALPPAALAARYEDSGMAWVGAGGAGLSGRAGAAEVVPPDALVAGALDEQGSRLAELVRVLRPSTVVTYEPGGGYGHPDHVRAHQIAMRALELASEPSETSPGHQPADVWWTVVPAGVLRRGRAQLVDAVDAGLVPAGPATLVDPDGPLPAVAAGDHAVVAVLDARPVLDRVEGALRAHATQVHRLVRVRHSASGDDHVLVGAYALSNDVLVPWLGTEFYARATGPDAGPSQPVPSVER